MFFDLQGHFPSGSDALALSGHD